MEYKSYKSVTDDLMTKIRAALGRTTGARLLKDYSPWLSSFQAHLYSESIEVPGQYDGHSKPLPEYHVKISGFDEKVSSLYMLNLVYFSMTK